MAGVEKVARMIRGNQMAPLSAASMEKGSYLRGYEHLTRFVLRFLILLFVRENVRTIDFLFDFFKLLFHT